MAKPTLRFLARLERRAWQMDQEPTSNALAEPAFSPEDYRTAALLGETVLTNQSGGPVLRLQVLVEQEVESDGDSRRLGVVFGTMKVGSFCDHVYNSRQAGNKLGIYLARQDGVPQVLPEVDLIYGQRFSETNRAAFHRVRFRPVHGLGLLFDVWSTPVFERRSSGRFAWRLLAAGMSISLMSSAVVALLARSRVKHIRHKSEADSLCRELIRQRAERAELFRNLHDGVAQLVIGAEKAVSDAPRHAADPDSLNARLKFAGSRLREAVGELRGYMDAGGCPSIAAEALPAAIREHLRAMGGAHEIEVGCEIDDASISRMDEEVVQQVWHAVREAVSNACRHSGAKAMEVGLRLQEGHWLLVVRDDGRGFEPDARQGGRGLANLRDRAAKLGGSFDLVSAVGSGCEIRWRIPAREKAVGSEPGRARPRVLAGEGKK